MNKTIALHHPAGMGSWRAYIERIDGPRRRVIIHAGSTRVRRHEAEFDNRRDAVAFLCQQMKERISAGWWPVADSLKAPPSAVSWSFPKRYHAIFAKVSGVTGDMLRNVFPQLQAIASMMLGAGDQSVVIIDDPDWKYGPKLSFMAANFAYADFGFSSEWDDLSSAQQETILASHCGHNGLLTPNGVGIARFDTEGGVNDLFARITLYLLEEAGADIQPFCPRGHSFKAKDLLDFESYKGMGWPAELNLSKDNYRRILTEEGIGGIATSIQVKEEAIDNGNALFAFI